MDIITFNMVNNEPCIIKEMIYKRDDIDIFVSKVIELFSKKGMSEKVLINFVQKYSQTISEGSVERIIKTNANKDTSQKVIQYYMNIYSNMESLSIEDQKMIEEESTLNVKRNIVFVILYDIAKDINITF